MSDTPIFDQLAKELNYARMVYDAKKVPAYTGKASSIQGARPVGMYIDEWNGGQTDDAVNAAPTAPAEDTIVFQKVIPVTTLAKLAEGTQQE